MIKESWSFAGRVWLYYLFSVVIGVFMLLPIDPGVLHTILSISLVVGVMALCFNDGGYRGDRACTMGATIERLLKDGRNVDPDMYNKVWNKKVAALMLVFTVIPLMLVAGLNLIFTEPNDDLVTTAVEEPEEVFDDSYYVVNNEEGATIAPFRVATAILFSPFAFAFSIEESTRFYLYFLFALPVPLSAFAGYMMGPKLHERKIKDMMKGKRKKMKNLKVNRQPKPPKAEV